MSILPSNRLEHLQANYTDYIAVPWRPGASAMERVLFLVYDKDNERALRLRLDEFRQATVAARHPWAQFDLTDTYAEWLQTMEYAERYFARPEFLTRAHPLYLEYLVAQFAAFAKTRDLGDQYVVALTGVGSLFGILRVRDLVDQFAPHVTGRLAVFFPGTYDRDNYRLLDQHDGWNYLAVPLTSDKQF